MDEHGVYTHTGWDNFQGSKSIRELLEGSKCLETALRTGIRLQLLVKDVDGTPSYTLSSSLQSQLQSIYERESFDSQMWYFFSLILPRDAAKQS